MLLTEKVTLKWNNAFKKYYISKGYEYTKNKDEFEVTMVDLQKTSTAKVDVVCDYCESKCTKEYRVYINQREIVEKDCCSNRQCMISKTKEVSLIVYGVESVNQLESKRQQARLLYQTPIEVIIKLANEKGLTIVDHSNYENKNSKIKVICSNHPELGIHETTAEGIKVQSHCCKIGGAESVGNIKRLDGDVIIQAFIDKGLIPLFSASEYKTNSQSLPYKCPNHPNEVQYRQYTNLQSSDGCLECSKERTSMALRINQEVVFDYFKSRDLIVEHGESYENKDKHIACRCVPHMDEIQYKTYHGLKNTIAPCEYCRNDKSISELNRVLRSSTSTWRKQSENDCNYKCMLTGSIEYEVHHTYSFNQVIKDALKILEIDILNYTSKDIINIKNKVVELHKDIIGVCLSPILHNLYHSIYGKWNNTPEQFDEFTDRFVRGEFNQLLHNNE